MKLSTAAACAALLAAAPASASALEKEATTPSGRPEMIFAHTGLTDAVTAISSECMDQGWMVTSQMANQVVCEVPLGIWQSALTQMLIGNSYSTPPKSFVRFSMAQTGEHTRVQSQSWAETQMVFGQVQQQAHNDDGSYNNMLGFMALAGAQYPVGTAFNARAFLGVNGEAATWQDGRRNRYGHRLTTVTPGAPAHDLGLQVGDIVAKINNRNLRDDEDVTRQLNRQRVGQPITLTVVRNGEQMTVSGTAEGRPAITTLVDPRRVPEGQSPAALQLAAAIVGSVDEALAMYAEATGAEIPTVQASPAVEVAATPVVESELDKARREAAEAQARLQALEAGETPAEVAE